MSKKYVRIETDFLLTDAGAPIVEILNTAYPAWKTSQSASDERTKRREMLMATGLLKEGAKPIENGLEGRVETVFAEQDGLSLLEIVDAINDILKEEGNGEKVTLAQVRSFVNFHCLQHKDRRSGEEVGFLKKEGKGDHATYHKVTSAGSDEEESAPKQLKKVAKALQKA